MKHWSEITVDNLETVVTCIRIALLGVAVIIAVLLAGMAILAAGG